MGQARKNDFPRFFFWKQGTCSERQKGSDESIADLEQWKCCAYKCRPQQLRSGTSARIVPNVIPSRLLVSELNFFGMETSCTQKAETCIFPATFNVQNTRVQSLIVEIFDSRMRYRSAHTGGSRGPVRSSIAIYSICEFCVVACRLLWLE